jgi:hypothetical protein
MLKESIRNASSILADEADVIFTNKGVTDGSVKEEVITLVHVALLVIDPLLCHTTDPPTYKVATALDDGNEDE